MIGYSVVAEEQQAANHKPAVICEEDDHTYKDQLQPSPGHAPCTPHIASHPLFQHDIMPYF